ncbi:hypothetical protein HN011_005392 [Eciton burchellii]|nr:hypothetical protein HN011_005392 [Eciton burchellii]
MPPRRRRISDLRRTPVSTAWRHAGTQRCNISVRRRCRLSSADNRDTTSHPRWHEGESRASRTGKRRRAASRRSGRTIGDVASSARAGSEVCRIFFDTWNRRDEIALIAGGQCIGSRDTASGHGVSRRAARHPATRSIAPSLNREFYAPSGGSRGPRLAPSRLGRLRKLITSTSYVGYQVCAAPYPVMCTDDV